MKGSRREFIWRAGCLGAAAVACPQGLFGADGSRVFVYDLDVSCGGKSVKKGRIMAAGFSVPRKESDRTSVCLAALSELPKGCDAVVTATPEDCFGLTGRPLTATVRL